MYLLKLKVLIPFNNKNMLILRAYSTDNIMKKVYSPECPTIGRTVAEQESLYLQSPEVPLNPKLLKASILGVPSSGKSTLVNRLMNRRISAVSSKINTTRKKINAVITDRDTQLIIYDTPGLVSLGNSKRFNLERQMIIDPHSSLWESDLTMVVHDVSDEYNREKISPEVLKCLFAHPDKESILVLNKIDKLKNKKVLLDLVLSLTGGILNGKEFVPKKRENKNRFIRNSLRDQEFEELFARTAEKMNITLKDDSKTKKIQGLLDELKVCEEFLIKNQERIKIHDKEGDEANQTVQLVDSTQRISIEKLDADYMPNKLAMSTNSSGLINKEVNLAAVIADQSKMGNSVLRQIEDISPIEFKKDLLETTDWHMYYRKLESLSFLIRGKTYWPYFNQVFMISAKTNEGVEELKRYLFSRARPNDWIFTRNMMTDQMPQEMAEMCVREKMLENLPKEIPYELGLQTSHWELDDNDCLNIIMNIKPGCTKYKFKRHMDALFKNSGKFIQQIQQEALQEIMNTFQCEAKLRLIIDTKPPY